MEIKKAENIETIFPLEGNESELHIDESERKALAALPFKGKVKPAGGKKAIILLGAPCSGKSTMANEVFHSLPEGVQATIVPICYDESVGLTGGRWQNINQPGTGALFNIKEYATAYASSAKVLAAAKETHSVDEVSHQKRKMAKIYRNNRSDSQRIRSMTLNAAVDGGYNVLIDTTSSSGGVLKMINALKEQGYEIEIWGCVSPFKLAQKRAEERLRIVEKEEVLTKRVGAYEMFKPLFETADRFRLFFSANNEESAKEVFSTDGIKMRVDSDLLEKVRSMIVAEGQDDASIFKKAVLESIKKSDRQPLLDRMKEAVLNIQDCLFTVFVTNNFSRKAVLPKTTLSHKPG